MVVVVGPIGSVGAVAFGKLVSGSSESSAS